MSPATIALLIGLVEELIKDTPALVTEFQAIFAKENPTPQDWFDLREKVLSQSFESLAPDAPLVESPAGDTTAAAPAPVVTAAEVAAVKVICQKCGQELLPNHPSNCACA